jgi:hypothetical protein
MIIKDIHKALEAGRVRPAQELFMVLRGQRGHRADLLRCPPGPLFPLEGMPKLDECPPLGVKRSRFETESISVGN